MKFLFNLNIFDRDRMLEILQVFLTNPFRTFLSGLGVGWGLFMIVVTVGASNGLENGVTSDMGGSDYKNNHRY